MSEILSADEYERRIMASMFGTPESEVGVLIAHDRAQRAEVAALTAERDEWKRNAHAALRSMREHIADADAAVAQVADRDRTIARLREAFRIASEHTMSTNDDDELPWLMDRYLAQAEAALAVPEGDTP